MIYVEGGSFLMGCTDKDGICYPGEKPAHTVTLTDFYMGEFQVTQKLWNAVMGSTIQQQSMKIWSDIDKLEAEFDGKKTHFNIDVPTSLNTKSLGNEYNKYLNGVGDNYPMYFINYYECEEFCNRLNQLVAAQLPEGYRFKMPTEAQWEYAARGGGSMNRNLTYSGSNHINDVAWYIANSKETTSEVGKKLPNNLGIYDMSGNVWEWCRDRYDENYYSVSPTLNPKGPEKGKQYKLRIPYVLRGGSWDKTGWCSRVTTRESAYRDARTKSYGFRLVLEPPPKLTGSGFFGYIGNFTASRLSSSKNLTFKLNDVKFEMVFVQGGTFSMGCSNNNTNCDSIEKPAHNVTLSNFYLGKFEVTQKLWQAVMGTNVSEQRDMVNPDWAIYQEGADYPMYYVNYEECEAFCEKLNKMLYYQLPEGYQFVIPTEAQWEYACRGGKRSSNYIYSGGNKINRVAWWAGNSGSQTRKVGLKSGNELGIYDMSGNVWEWCRDWFEDVYYSYSSTTNPQGPLSGTERVIRGGSWNLAEWHSRATTRFADEPQIRSANLGFRIALQPAKDFFDVKTLKKAIKNLTPKLSSPKNRSFIFGNINFEMVFVEGGAFTMGCTTNSNDCHTNEKPAHSVTLSDFYVGKYQVTQELWTKVMGTTLKQQRDLGNPDWELCGEGDLFPMYYINYKECAEFCNKLNQLLTKQLPEGYKFDIPTEAQWEFAARGGKKSKGYLYSGGDILGSVGWYDEFSYEQLYEVGLKKKNELGIYDMSGNVWEWCKDWFDFYSVKPVTNPKGPPNGHYRMLRGGSWRSFAPGCRVSCRLAAPPYERTRSYGLRLALVKVVP